MTDLDQEEVLAVTLTLIGKTKETALNSGSKSRELNGH